MASITTRITPPPKVAGRFDIDFIETADKFLNQLPDMSVQMNNFANQVNDTHDEMNSYRIETTNSKNKAHTYAEEAIKSANEIKHYTIPNEATYSLNALETALNDLLTQNVAQQLQLNILKDNVDIEILQNKIDSNLNKINDLQNQIDIINTTTIPELALGVRPFTIAININPDVSHTTTGFLTDYQENDEYHIYINDTSIVSDASIDVSHPDDRGVVGITVVFSYTTTTTAGHTSIIVTRVRNGYKSQAVINITSH